MKFSKRQINVSVGDENYILINNTTSQLKEAVVLHSCNLWLITYYPTLPSTMNYTRWRSWVNFSISCCGKYQMAALWDHLTKIELLENNFKLSFWSIKYISFSKKLGNIVKNALKMTEVKGETKLTTRHVVYETPLPAFRLITRRAVMIKRCYIFGWIL